MIDRIVAFALRQRFVTLAMVLLVTAGGIVSFARLPIEAYPDVADVEVDVITLWPGHAAEEVERHITLQLEKELNGIAGVTFLRSFSNFGLSNVRILFADGTDNYWARQQVQERIAQAEIPADAHPQLGPLASVIGEVYRYTLHAKTMPLVELKALQDWVLERELRSVPGVVDVVSWGGGIKQYQITIDPARLRAYNLTLKQVFDAVSANNANDGGSYIRDGQYALMVRGIGLVRSLGDLESIVIAAQKGTPVRVRDIGQASIGHAIRFGVLGRDDEDDLVQGIVLMRKGENPGADHGRVKKKRDGIRPLLPAGVEMRPYYSRDRLVSTTVATVMRNLVEGALLVTVLLSLFLYNMRAALIVALVIPLSLLFAFVFMDLRGIPANLLSLGAIDFGIIVDGAVIMTENILRHLAERRPRGQEIVPAIQHATLEVARPLTFAVLIIMTVYVPILTFQRIEGKLFRPMAVTISVAVVSALALTLTLIPVLATFLFRRAPRERESPFLRWMRQPYARLLSRCVRRPLLPLAGAVGLFVLAGVKGGFSIQIFGPDVFTLEAKAKAIANVLGAIEGVADLDYEHLVGQPQPQIVVDRKAAARYGINIQDVQDAIEAQTRGRVVGEIFEGERRFNVAVRLAQEGEPLASLRTLAISAPSGERIPLDQVAEFVKTEGLAQVVREGSQRRIAVKWSVRGRDMGGLVAEAMRKVDAAVKLPQGYRMVWSGRFEDQQRALARLYLIVPLAIFIMFVLLYGTFQSVGTALLIMLNLPFALIGGTLALYLWRTNFNISAAVGYIAVFGVSVLNGVVLVT